MVTIRSQLVPLLSASPSHSTTALPVCPPAAPQAGRSTPKPPPPHPPQPQQQGKPSYSAGASSELPTVTIHARESLSPIKKQKLKPNPHQLINPINTKINRDIIDELASPSPDTPTNHAILTAANNALISTMVKLVLVRCTRKAYVSILTNHNTPYFPLETSFVYLSIALRHFDLKRSSLRVNSRWSKFIQHGVPTNVGQVNKAGLQLSASIMEANPELIICQIPR